MSQNEEKTKKDKAEGEETAEAAPKTGSGKKKLILFGGIGLGVVVIGVALALFVLKPMMSGPAGQASAQEQSEQVQSPSPASEKAQGHGASKESHGGGHGQSATGSLIYAIKEIVVNPAGTGGSRFLSASVAFELGSPQLQEAFTAKEAMVRDALITILSSKSVTQLTDPKQKEITRYQIRKRVSELLQTGDLAGVFFTDFVLQ